MARLGPVRIAGPPQQTTTLAPSSAYQGRPSTAGDRAGGFHGTEALHRRPRFLYERYAAARGVRPGWCRRIGFVEMATAQEADAAVKKFNGQELDGRTLKVEIAKPSGLGGGARSGGGARNSGFGRSRW